MNAATFPSPQIPFKFVLNEDFDLDTFLLGSNTRLLLELLDEITTGRQAHSLYIWGEPGAGKSHLLQAACKRAHENNRCPVYIPLRQSRALRPDILHDLGKLNLVCIDDIESVHDDLEWQRGLIWLYNELRDNGNALIISANSSPLNINIALEDLKSRLSWGQVYHLKSPGDEVKIKILKRAANTRAFDLSDEVIEYLIRRVDRDLNSLIKLLDEIDQASLTAQRKVTVPFVKAIIN